MRDSRRRLHTGIARELLWVAGGQAVAAIGLLVAVRVLTSHLEPAEYGEFSLGLTISVLLNQVMVGPVTSALVRFFSPAVEKNEFQALLLTIRRFARGFVAGALGLALCLAILAALTRWHWAVVALPAVCLSAVAGLEQSLDGIQTAARQRVVVAFHSGLGAWAKFTVALLLFKLVGGSSVAALWGYAIATTIQLASQVLFFNKRIAKIGSNDGVRKEPGHWEREVLGFARPLAVWGVFQWALVVSDRYALAAFSGTSEVGLYNVAYQVGYYPITILSAILMQLLVPMLYELAGDGKDDRRLTQAKALALRLAFGFASLTGAAAAILWIFHRQIFSLLVAPAYHSVSVFVPFLLLAAGLFAAGQLAAQAPLLEMNPRGLLFTKLATSGLGVVFNIVGAYLFGVPGVVGAAVLFSVIYLLWMTSVARRRGPLNASSRSDVKAIGE